MSPSSISAAGLTLIVLAVFILLLSAASPPTASTVSRRDVVEAPFESKHPRGDDDREDGGEGDVASRAPRGASDATVAAENVSVGSPNSTGSTVSPSQQPWGLLGFFQPVTPSGLCAAKARRDAAFDSRESRRVLHPAVASAICEAQVFSTDRLLGFLSSHFIQSNAGVPSARHTVSYLHCLQTLADSHVTQLDDVAVTCRDIADAIVAHATASSSPNAKTLRAALMDTYTSQALQRSWRGQTDRWALGIFSLGNSTAPESTNFEWFSEAGTSTEFIAKSTLTVDRATFLDTLQLVQRMSGPAGTTGGGGGGTGALHTLTYETYLASITSAPAGRYVQTRKAAAASTAAVPSAKRARESVICTATAAEGNSHLIRSNADLRALVAMDATDALEVYALMSNTSSSRGGDDGAGRSTEQILGKGLPPALEAQRLGRWPMPEFFAPVWSTDSAAINGSCVPFDGFVAAPVLSSPQKLDGSDTGLDHEKSNDDDDDTRGALTGGPGSGAPTGKSNSHSQAPPTQTREFRAITEQAVENVCAGPDGITAYRAGATAGSTLHRLRRARNELAQTLRGLSVHAHGVPISTCPPPPPSRASNFSLVRQLSAAVVPMRFMQSDNLGHVMYRILGWYGVAARLGRVIAPSPPVVLSPSMPSSQDPSVAAVAVQPFTPLVLFAVPEANKPTGSELDPRHKYRLFQQVLWPSAFRWMASAAPSQYASPITAPQGAAAPVARNDAHPTSTPEEAVGASSGCFSRAFIGAANEVTMYAPKSSDKRSLRSSFRSTSAALGAMRNTLIQCVAGPSIAKAAVSAAANSEGPPPTTTATAEASAGLRIASVPALRLPLSKRDDLNVNPVRIVWIRRATRRLLNEKYLLSLLPIALADTPHTLLVASFEHLAPNDQALLALTADILIGVHGTALQWALLMRPGAVMVEIQSPQHRCTPTGLNHGGRIRCEFGRTTLAVGVNHLTWSVEASQIAKTFGGDNNGGSAASPDNAATSAGLNRGEAHGHEDVTAAPAAPPTEAFKDLQIDPKRMVFLLRRAVCVLHGRRDCDYHSGTPVDVAL